MTSSAALVILLTDPKSIVDILAHKPQLACLNHPKQKPMDIIYLRDLRIDAVIGIYDWERRMKQTVILDLEMAADIGKAAGSDDIADALNYKSVAKRLIRFVEESEFKLVETLAERIAEIVLTEFDVPWCRLTLNKKGALRYARDVGVIIERGQKP